MYNEWKERYLLCPKTSKMKHCRKSAEAPGLFQRRTEKKAGLTLRKENQEPGSWGYLYNEGDYYWNGQKLSPSEANAIVHYVKDYGFQPKTLQEALDKYN